MHEIPEDRIHDTREDSPMFQALPADVQDEFRDRWRHAEGTSDRFRDLRRYTWKVYAAEMAVTFVFFYFWIILAHPLAIFWAAATGALTGVVAGFLRAGQILYPVLAGVGYVASGSFNVFAVLGVVAAAALMGRLHHMRRFEGLEA